MSAARGSLLRSRPGRFSVAVVGLVAVFAVALAVISYRISVRWFETTKFEEKITALRLVEAFVAEYTDIRGNRPGADAPVPATFRAHSIQRFNDARVGIGALHLEWLGVPGREIRSAPRDVVTAAAISAAARDGNVEPTSRWWETDGDRVFRTVAPSVATQQGCVDCHNQYLQGQPPWHLNDVMGAFVIDVPAEDFLTDARNQSALLGVAFFVIAAAVSGVVLRLQYLRHAAAIDAATSAERERAALDSKRAAESASRAKSEFLALMSHELRTPLNAIIGFSEIMAQELRGAVPAHYRGYARDIHQSGQHLMMVIGDILDIAKAESNRLDLLEEEEPLEEIIQPCLRLVAPRAAASRVALRAGLPTGIRLRCDVTKLRQIVLNLLSNAVKFTRPGGRIEVSGFLTRDGCLTINVTDTGIGISPEDVPRAFSPFEQIESMFRRKHEGTGLGLPLAKALAELHDGKLQLSSVLGRGTQVSVTLPADRVLSAASTAAGAAPAVLTWDGPAGSLVRTDPANRATATDRPTHLVC